jgi:hypothetical protein
MNHSAEFKQISVADTVYYVQEQRRINSFMSRMAEKFKTWRKNRVVDEWICTVDDTRHLKQTARKVVKHMMNRTIAITFNTWWSNADRRRRNAQRALRAVQRLKNRAQVNSLEMWCIYTDEKHRLQECFAAAVEIANHGILVWSLEEWSCNAYNLAERKRRHQELRHKVIRQMQNLLLAACWERWCARMDRKSRVQVCKGCWIWIPTSWVS